MELFRRCFALACVVVCLCLWASPATAAGASRRLAVLEFSGQSLEPGVLNAFSDAVRGSALAVLGNREVKVMTREAMLSILRDMGKADLGIYVRPEIGIGYAVGTSSAFHGYQGAANLAVAYKLW